jgi:hypothetical protein
MQMKNFSAWVGGIYLLLGIFGFVPFLVSEPAADAPSMNVTSAFGQLFAIFPVNSLLNIVHAIMGIIGLYAYTTTESAKSYTRWCAGIYGVMAILGILPFARTFFGLFPLYSHNIWLHGVTALAASYYATRKPQAVGAGGAESLGAYREGKRASGERKPSDLDKAG